MADKKKKKNPSEQGKKAEEKVTKSALRRGMESSKKQKAAAIKAKPKNPTQQQQQEDKKRQGGLREYFRGVVTETKKVVWPTRKELVSYTIIVLIACAFFGVFLWGVDTGFLAVIREVFSINMN
ncbi:MAG: preprotein translocase subunit SecE [Clostridiales bacterium]|nr:preprotein translocase subunit SecE [Clostridiales bacterium]